MSRINKIAKKIVGYEIEDIKYALEEYIGGAVGATKAMRDALSALQNNDVNMAFNAIARLSPRAASMIPSHITEWLEENAGKVRPREGWKVQVQRAIGQVFGRGQMVRWEYSNFLTFTEGTSNKFHFFAVVKTEDGEYVGGNAYGKIGSNPKVIEIARSKSRGQVMSIVESKEDQKRNKGYITS